ncbi:MAG TPA: DNA modification methylase, partial [Spirochaetia bacterium]|nr:DNA modification methylase [Spirochaetia bacterium]
MRDPAVYPAAAWPLENEDYLRRQVITCLGNKRALLPFIGGALEEAAARCGKKRLKIFDVFSGSGI